MRQDRLVPGVVLVLIGVAFLLRSFDVVHFHFWNFVKLWPILLIIGGVNLVFANNKSGWATALKLGVAVAGIGLLLFGDFGNRYNFFPTYSYRYNDNDNDNDDDVTVDSKDVVKVEGSSKFNEPFTPGTQLAQLNVYGGAITYKLKDTTAQLFSADTREFFDRFELNRRKEGNVEVIDFRMRNRKNRFHWDSDKSNEAVIKLNTAPEWDINVKTGATSLDFDLTKFKVRNFKIDGGAAEFDVKMGQPLNLTTVTVNTGVSDVTINIPKDAACSIIAKTGISSNEFDGFVEKGNNRYETANYSSAANKFEIHISGGISDFKVKRY